MSKQFKFMLDESNIPKAWYNINADMPVHLARVLHPATKKPVNPNSPSPFLPMALHSQDVSTERIGAY
jgi:tryptophan synthase beta chain